MKKFIPMNTKGTLILRQLLISISFFAICFLLFVWLTTEHFSDLESAEILCPSESKPVDLRQSLKVLTWNIQFLAGKNYIFFYDAMDGSGKDEAPSEIDTKISLQEVTRVLQDENPDFILLQEVDVHAKRTYYQDQVKLIYDQLSKRYPCYTSTFYWRAGFVPHPHIMGSIGMKLAIFSKYTITQSQRYALGEFPADIISRQFRPKRALLDATIPSLQGLNLHILNTHLEAYSQGSDLMQRQIKIVSHRLEELEQKSSPWILGGDFNLLMPGKSYFDLSPTQRALYQEHSELQVLTDHFAVLPFLSEVNGVKAKDWYTHFPNDPEVKGPDRTIDYLFYGTQLKTTKHYVRSQDTLKISDHLPLIGEFENTFNF